MAHSHIKTFITFGLTGHEITIEADINKALPTIEIIGLPDAAVKESKERLRATFRNLAIALPPHKIVLNLAPSDIKKSGTQFDVPMATAILLLVCGHVYHADILSHSVFFGELGLNGSIKRINGILPAVIAAKKSGYSAFFVPVDNVHELAYVPGIKIYPLSSFNNLVAYFVQGVQLIEYEKPEHTIETVSHNSLQSESAGEFGSIRGHLVAKRALSVAAAGGHNVLMVGAPGSGKTLLSHAMQSIMPPLQFEEMIEVSEIYSLVGKLTKENPLITTRPFRAVHHTASKIALVGGGVNLQPGEMSLAHKGILFLDELPEFPRETLEVLRQPLEDKTIMISRAAGSVSYPAHCMLIAAMNPCKCGYYKDPEKSCSCSLSEVARYQSKISGPLLDRIDMLLEIPRESADSLFEKNESMSSASLYENTLRAREVQQKRYLGTSIFSNAGLNARQMYQYIHLEESAETFLKQAAQKLHFSGRIIHRIMKLSRTIADMEASESVELSHVAEAMHYRSKTMFVEGG